MNLFIYCLISSHYLIKAKISIQPDLLQKRHTSRKMNESPLRSAAIGGIGLEKPLLFTEYAAAVLLAVKSHLLGLPDAFFPSDPEVLVIKWDLNFPGDRLCGCADEIVLLIAAVEQGRREGVEEPLSGLLGCVTEPYLVTVAAAVLPQGGCLLEEILYGIAFGHGELKAFPGGVFPNRIEALFVLEEGVDVRVEKQPLQRNPLLTKDAKGIDRARRTAEVKKDFHKTTVYPVCLVYLVYLVFFS